jgi:DNA-binding IclR family transcriptional regulator
MFIGILCSFTSKIYNGRAFYISVNNSAPFSPISAIAAGLRTTELKTILDKYIQDGLITGDRKPALLSEIQHIREAGFAISTGERVPGSGSIGVPIKDILNNTQASLSISTVLDRMTEENIQTYLELLIYSSAQIQSQVIW